jgi:hypothetical protein
MRALVFVAFAAVAVASPAVTVVVDKSTGAYTVAMDGKAWYESPIAPAHVCVGGKQVVLKFKSANTSSGSDKFGAWSGTTASFYSDSPSAAVDFTFKHVRFLFSSSLSHPNHYVAKLLVCIEPQHCGRHRILPSWT